MFQRGRALGAGPAQMPVRYAVLEDPWVVYVAGPVKANETPEQALARMEAFVSQCLAAELGPAEVAAAKLTWAMFLGTADLPERALVMNPYGVALGLARRRQLGVDPAKLRKAIEAVTAEDVRQVAKEVFAPSRRAEVIIALDAQ